MAPDFGQYTQEQVFDWLKPKKGTGVCERCGQKTRTKTFFGMTVCNDCLAKQYPNVKAFQSRKKKGWHGNSIGHSNAKKFGRK